jgi:hypothetical protein
MVRQLRRQDRRTRFPAGALACTMAWAVLSSAIIGGSASATEPIPSEESQVLPSDESQVLPSEEDQVLPSEEDQVLPSEEDQVLPSEEDQLFSTAEENDFGWWNCRIGNFEKTCAKRIPFRLEIHNRSGAELAVVPHTSTQFRPHVDKGSGFTSEPEGGLSGLKFEERLALPSGGATTSTASLWLVADSGTNDPRHLWDALAQFDVVDPRDGSVLERAQLRQSRDHERKNSSINGSIDMRLKNHPSLEVLGTGQVRASLEAENAASPFESVWRLIIEDAEAPEQQSPTTLTPTRLTPDPKVGEKAEWQHLSRPIVRIDVSDATKTWKDNAPDSVAVNPSSVTGTIGTGTKSLGQLTPNSEATINGGKISFGESSFYFQDVPGTSRSLPLPDDGSWFTLEDNGRALQAAADGAGTAPERRGAANGTSVVDSQQMRLIPGMQSRYQVQARIPSADGTALCLQSLGETAGFRPCDPGLAAQNWALQRSNTSKTSIDAWTLRSMDGSRSVYHDGDQLRMAPASTTGSLWRFTTTEPLPQVRDIQLHGGWLGDTRYVMIWNLEAPTPPTFTTDTPSTLSLLSAAGGTSGSTSLVPNGLDSDAIEVTIRSDNGTITKDSHLGAIYDHLFFVDRDNKLITGLDNDIAPAVTPVRPRQGDTVGNEPASKHHVYVTTGSKSTSQIVGARLAIDKLRISGSGAITIVSRPEAAAINEQLLGKGMTLICTPVGGISTGCPVADPAGALSRDHHGELTLHTRYRAITSGTTDNALFAATAMYSPKLLRSSTGTVRPDNPYLGQWPGNKNEFAMDVLIVTEAGTPATGWAYTQR